MFALIALEKINKPLTYKIPQNFKCNIGQAVVVPLGKQKVLGYILEFQKSIDFNPSLVKEIISVPKEEFSLSEDLVELAMWISSYYVTPIFHAISAMLPSGTKQLKNFSFSVRKKAFLMINQNLDNLLIQKELKKAPKQLELFNLLVNAKIVPYDEISSVIANNLINKGYAKKVEKEVNEQINLPKITRDSAQKIVLTDEQKLAIETIVNSKDQNFLLHGVTSSGKTQVFIEIIKAIKCGAIILVPEINLTPQTVAYFEQHFGDKATILHSQLSAAQKKQAYKKISDGQINIVIGARSAIFAPVKNLGIIIVDEEHESTYKQEVSPRYNAKSVANKRAKLLGAKLILASATPSIVSYFQTETKNMQLIEMKQKIKTSPPPNVSIVDLTQNTGANQFVSNLLIKKLKERIEKKEQSILFLNKRGLANFLFCPDCKTIVSCPHCSVSLKVHHNVLKCHYCGYLAQVQKTCSNCSGQLINIGKGTISLEQELTKIFPTAKIARMDKDTAGSFEETVSLINEFSSNEFDILIGTQMVAKGHDFANVTLVGIINADLSLQIPDFLANERTFNLITQVSGRAGRREKQGEVVIQTFLPDNQIILAALEMDYQKYYLIEKELRKPNFMPPYSKLIRILLEHPQNDILEEEINKIKVEIEPFIQRKAQILGPAPALIEKIQNKLRYHILLKFELNTNLSPLKSRLLEILISNKYKSKIIIDVDPQNFI